MCEFDFNIFLYGVEPVYKDHSLDPKLVVTIGECRYVNADSIPGATRVFKK
jgi:hypothetical protein